ncbi:DUF6950 family protein [Rhizobium leguminosarum]|uniref:DUF6950 family protein n=1 Tax=Rhizobium leguminosarum TaxID=384 RepID=UPI003CFF7594
MTDLEAFIAENNKRGWRPGEVDCCMFLASWAIWRGHPDPAAQLRGTYSDEAGFRSIVTEAGGVVPVVQRCIESIGGRLVDRPKHGVVGVIGSHSDMTRQWGAIFDGSRWLMRFRDNVGPVAARPLAIWEI